MKKKTKLISTFGIVLSIAVIFSLIFINSQSKDTYAATTDEEIESHGDYINDCYVYYDGYTKIKDADHVVAGKIYYALSDNGKDLHIYGTGDMTSTNFSNINVNFRNLEQIFFEGDSKSATIRLTGDCSDMFQQCYFTEIIAFTNFSAPKCTSLAHLCDGCANLRYFYFNSDALFTAVTDTSYMFNNCKLLSDTCLIGLKNSKIANAKYMFGSCENLGFSDISDVPFNYCKDMSFMFQGCKALGFCSMTVNGVPDRCFELNFNTANLLDAQYMFDGCENLNLKLGTKATFAKCTNFSGMFRNSCKGTYLYLYPMNMVLAKEADDMFDGCRFDLMIPPSKLNTKLEIPLDVWEYETDYRYMYTKGSTKEKVLVLKDAGGKDTTEIRYENLKPNTENTPPKDEEPEKPVNPGKAGDDDDDDDGEEAKPENPTNPSNPSNPTNPTTPTNPIDEDEPTNPTNPSNPTTPTVPTTPEVPVVEKEKIDITSKVSITVNDTANIYYTGKEVKPSVTVTYNSKTLKLNTDYKLSYYNNVNAGSAAGVTVQGIGEYTGGKSKTFTIKKLKITDAEYHVEKYNSNNLLIKEVDGTSNVTEKLNIYATSKLIDYQIPLKYSKAVFVDENGKEVKVADNVKVLSIKVTSISLQDTTNLELSTLSTLMLNNTGMIKNSVNHFAYMSGYSDGTFRPKNAITRAEFAKVVALLAGYDESEKQSYIDKTQNYSDIKDDSWFAPYCGYLIKYNLMTGNNGKFRPNDKITRAETCKVLADTFEIKDLNKSTRNFTKEISGKWYQRPCEILIKGGIINGYTDKTFRANNNVTRAELVTMINKIKRVPINKDIMQEAKLYFQETYSDVKQSDWYYLDVYEAVTDHEYGLLHK